MARQYKRSDGYHEKDLIQYGVDHIIAAETLFKGNPRFFDSAGYLCHIGFELLFKAIFLFKNNYFENNHSLKDMLPTIKEYIDISTEQECTINIADDYSELRYPITVDPYEVGSDEWKNIDTLLKHIMASLPQELKTYADTIDYSRKGGRVLMYREMSDS